MTEQKTKIIRTINIVVDKIYTDTYENLRFTDKEEIEYKVGVNRKSFFEKIIVPGAAVQLNFALTPGGKEYVYNATPIKDLLPATQKPVPKPIVSVSETVTQTDNLVTRASIETQVAAKVVGELMANGVLEKNTLLGKACLSWCYLKLTGKELPNVKEVPPKSLVTEAKEMGAAEE